MLSKALTTASSPIQKLSSNVSSVSPPTRTSMAVILSSLFMALAARAAVWDFACPTSLFLNKNWRFKFEISMLSMSVTVTCPPLPQPTPIMAKHFKYSQPRAPAPTRKTFMLASLSWKDLPRMATWSSYRLPRGFQSAGRGDGTNSNMSKYNAWCNGVYLPVNFTTSWATMPPKKAHIGEMEQRANNATFLTTSASTSSSDSAFASFFLLSFNSCASFTQAAAAASSRTRGSCPFCSW
mmetsp:Transcript_49424/g.141671  ORF Transcript_49424/g.141671 Transcript_49424/m.141671 type:complete len:238 (-) Transcript_49424:24-737(-)